MRHDQDHILNLSTLIVLAYRIEAGENDMKILAPLVMVAGQALAAPAGAQVLHDHAGHMSRAKNSAPNLEGDDTFGALAEVVAILSADPETDWSRVSIEELRNHLLDMNAVAKGPAPETREIDSGLEILIENSGPAGEAALRMVPHHAPVLEEETGWNSVVEKTNDGKILWRVTGNSPEEGEKILALGFFGLLATGAHHQTHHLAIAKGMPH